MLNFALFGVGRIGNVHANNIFSNKRSKLFYVYDINKNNAKKIAKKYNCIAANSPDEPFNDKRTNAVLISSPTNTHVDLIIKSAKHGLPVLCEKPIDLNINNIIKCEKIINKFKIPLQIGFNRRFDESHKNLKISCDKGIIGNKEMIIVTSRDPNSPPYNYIKNSGGIFRDMTIHDFDISRFILGEDEIAQVYAQGTNHFDNNMKKLKDHDTAMIIMKSKSGVLIHINNSRRAVYGYDQRIEVFGSKGMIVSGNQRPYNLNKYTNKITDTNEPLFNFFIDRYGLAFNNQLNSFINSILNKKKPLVTFDDGKKAIILANAAYKSLSTGRSVKI